MNNLKNDEEILLDATKAVFNCGASFSESKVVTITDEFNPQPTLQTQRTNLKFIYENKLPNEIGRQLSLEPEYQEQTRSMLVGHFKEMALEDLIEQQDYQNRYKQTDPELDQDNVNAEKDAENEYTSQPPEPRPW